MQLPLLPTVAKPFFKWAGGKSQLLEQINEFLPDELKRGSVKRYFEPFIGGGAVFFFVSLSYKVDELFIYDINPELVLAYRTIQKGAESLISLLYDIEQRYLSLSDKERETFFYKVRWQFNANHRVVDFSEYHHNWAERTAQMIFLNRTCFNGLFRVNSRGEFNVPAGKYKNPTICNRANLRAVSQALQGTHIHHGDFMDCEELVNDESFVYFDPPYKPISRTASFASYAKDTFDDSEQLRLAAFYCSLDRKGAKLMLSNSDPKNNDPDDDFFEDAYRGYRIERVKARRSINSNAQGRGQINELLIMNY